MTPAFDVRAAADALAGVGWIVLPDLLDAAQASALADECASMNAADQLVPARIGARRTRSALRDDRTHWFAGTAMSLPQQLYVDRMDGLRVALGRELRLSLVDCESHYAVYRPGAGYVRHLDRMSGNDARVISAVFYLNENWLDSEGGALRLYLADGGHRDIYPRAGTLLLFLSAHFEHEVLPATRNRMSIASWMRQRVVG